MDLRITVEIEYPEARFKSPCLVSIVYSFHGLSVHSDGVKRHLATLTKTLLSEVAFPAMADTTAICTQ